MAGVKIEVISDQTMQPGSRCTRRFKITTKQFGVRSVSCFATDDEAMQAGRKFLKDIAATVRLDIVIPIEGDE